MRRFEIKDREGNYFTAEEAMRQSIREEHHPTSNEEYLQCQVDRLSELLGYLTMALLGSGKLEIYEAEMMFSYMFNIKNESDY